MVRIPGFGHSGSNGGKEREPSSGGVTLPATLATDPQRKSVISYYVAEHAPLEAIREALGKKYPGMRSDHLDSAVTAISKKKDAKIASQQRL